MTLSVNHSAAAAHYTGLLDQLHAETILNALRDLEAAQRDAEKASVVCQSNDYELAQHEAQAALRYMGERYRPTMSRDEWQPSLSYAQAGVA